MSCLSWLKGGGNWKKENMLHIFPEGYNDEQDDEDEDEDTLSIPINHHRQLRRALNFSEYECKNAMIKNIYYYKEESVDIENYVKNRCIGVGMVVVCAFVAPPLLPSAGAAAGVVAAEVVGGGVALAKCAKIGAGIVGLVGAVGGLIGGLTTGSYAFHGFIVLECTDGLWISAEKNDERTVIQIGKSRDEVLRYKDGKVKVKKKDGKMEVAKRGKVSLLGEFKCPSVTIEEFLEWLITSKETEREFNIFTNNCKTFSNDVIKEFTAFKSQREHSLL